METSHTLYDVIGGATMFGPKIAEIMDCTRTGPDDMTDEIDSRSRPYHMISLVYR